MGLHHVDGDPKLILTWVLVCAEERLIAAHDLDPHEAAACIASVLDVVGARANAVARQAVPVSAYDHRATSSILMLTPPKHPRMTDAAERYQPNPSRPKRSAARRSASMASGAAISSQADPATVARNRLSVPSFVCVIISSM